MLTATGWMYCAEWLRYSGAAVGFMLPTLFLLRAVPLHAQRPTAMLALLCGLAWGEHVLPPADGMDWAWPVLVIKFVVAHVPRHEPYVDRPRPGTPLVLS